MLKSKSGQESFHAVLWATLLPADHELLGIRRSFDFSWVDEELSGYYRESGPGRPGFAPRSMFLMLFLEMYDRLSDYEVVERVRRDALYRYFVGFELEDEIPDHSTLSVFRERIGEAGFRRVFNRFIEELEKKGLISHRLKIVDATAVRADAELRGRVGILRQAQRKVKRVMKASDEKKFGNLSKAETEEVLIPKEQEEDRKVIEEETEKLKELLALARKEFGEEGIKAAEEIEELLFRVGGKAVGSLTDTDARIGHKSKNEIFYGYKAHTVTNESEIVTSAETISGNENERNDIQDLLKAEEERGIKGEAALADSLYASGENRRVIREEMGMQELIPAVDHGAQAEDFEYDAGKDVLICKAGKESLSWSPHDRGKMFYFSRYDCVGCARQSECESYSLREKRAKVLLSLERQMNLAVKIPKEEWKKLYKYRVIVERIYGRAKKWHGLGQARYRGRWRVAIQVFMTFLVMNAKKAFRIKAGLCPIKPPGLAALGWA